MNILEMRRRTLGKGVYKETAEGSAIVARSLARMRPGLKIMGKSTRKTTTGAQLFDFASIAPETLETNGVTVTNNKDGSFTVTGTPIKESGCIFTFHYFLNEPIKDGEYFASDDLVARIIKKDGTFEYNEGGFTFNSETDSGVGLYWQRSKDTYKDGETVWPMLNAGSTAIPWEPYTGGKPSPSPDYPQEIEIVGKGSRQLFDLKKATGFNTANGYNVSIDGDKIHVIGNNDIVGAVRLFNIDIMLPAGTYTLSISQALPYNVRLDSKIIISAGDLSKTVTFEEDTAITHMAIDSISGESFDFEFTIMLNTGSTALPWEPYRKGNIEVSVYGGNLFDVFNSENVREKLYNNGSSFVAEKGMRYEVKAYMNKEGSTTPVGAEKVYKNVRLVAVNKDISWETYKEPQTLTVLTPNGLPGIPVGSGGNYTDEDGQQWVCDEIDFRRGKYVQRIAHYVFDGSKDEGWNIIVASNSGIKIPYAYINVQRGVSQYDTKLLCNVGKYSTWNSDGTCFINEYERYFFYHPSIESILNQGIEAWRAWLEKNNIELLYILENPIETDLTPEQMQQYEAIHTNRPTTTVVNDAGCHMSLTYKTKKSLEVT